MGECEYGVRTIDVILSPSPLSSMMMMMGGTIINR